MRKKSATLHPHPHPHPHPHLHPHPPHPYSEAPAQEGSGSRRRHTVVVIAQQGLAPFEFAVPCEVFGIDRFDDPERPWYRFLVCAADPSPLATAAGFAMDVPLGLATLQRADTVVVAPPGNVTRENPALSAALRRAHRRGARIMSICTGAFTVAAAGLLDGRRATTHWLYSEQLREMYPAVNVDRDVLYVDDGDILTSAGTAAGIDLCLHVVGLDYGAEIANRVARQMVVPPHRFGGQAQFIADPVAADPGTDPLATTMAWTREHLDEPITVAAMARASAMSPRTFARRFRQMTGTTPLQWVARQRILLAQRLLETTDLSVELVAGRCGLGSATNLRQHFQRTVRASPQEYRRTFRAEAG